MLYLAYTTPWKSIKDNQQINAKITKDNRDAISSKNVKIATDSQDDKQAMF